MGTRKTRSDCTVGIFEKSMVYHQEQLETRMEETLVVIRKLEQFEKNTVNNKEE